MCELGERDKDRREKRVERSVTKDIGVTYFSSFDINPP